MIGCLWGLIKMKRSIGVNWAYRVTRGFAHCHMEHAEGPSAPFLVATLPIDYYFSFTSNLYLQNSFILSKIKNQKKLFLKNTFWKVILDKKLKENDRLRFKIRLCTKLCWLSWIRWFYWRFMGMLFFWFSRTTTCCYRFHLGSFLAGLRSPWFF